MRGFVPFLFRITCAFCESSPTTLPSAPGPAKDKRMKAQHSNIRKFSHSGVYAKKKAHCRYRYHSKLKRLRSAASCWYHLHLIRFHQQTVVNEILFHAHLTNLMQQSHIDVFIPTALFRANNKSFRQPIFRLLQFDCLYLCIYLASVVKSNYNVSLGVSVQWFQSFCFYFWVTPGVPLKNVIH